MGDGFCEHGLAASGRPVEEDAGGSRQEGTGVREQVRHRQRIDDGFLELVYYVLEAPDI